MAKGEEKKIEESIIKYLNEAHNAYVLDIHGSLFQKSGVPDIVCCIKGRWYAFEVKKKKQGKLSALQKAHIGLIRKSGGVAYAVTSLEEVKMILNEDYNSNNIIGHKIYMEWMM